MARVYATAADLSDYTDGSDFTVPSEPEATRVLTRASERIESVLLTAIYDTDDAGTPTDTNIADALRDAVCAQVVWWDETGDEHGTAGRYSTVSIGNVTLSGAARASDSDAIAPQAVTHLRLAGLTPGVVVTTAGW